MEKLTQIMNEIREYLHTFEELKDKSCIIETWIELEDNSKNILEEKEEKKIEHSDYKLLNSRLERLNKRINNVANNIAENPSKALLIKLKEHEEEKEKIEKQIQQLQVQQYSITKEDVPPLRRALAKKLRTANEPSVRSLLSSCVDNILVDNEGVTVSLSL